MTCSRRQMLKLASANAAAFAAKVLVGAAPLVGAAFAQGPQRVAAIQFEPKLGDTNANLARADALVREALGKGARYVVLPEFFPSGTAMHPSLFEAYQPVDGQAAQLLQAWAKAGSAYVGGSFLARSGGDAFNTFVLACPDGTTFTHDKDFPTMAFESAFYAGGEDAAYAEKLARDGARTASQKVAERAGNNVDGAFTHAGAKIGGALCWEIVRSRTARRLAGKVDILLASSGWWTADPEREWPGLGAAQARAGWSEHQALIGTAPQRMARMLGVPVVHANFTGANPGFATLAFDREGPGRYLGNSQVVDASGKTLARLATEQGVLLAEVTLGRATPTEAIPEDFWLPEVSESMRRRWSASGAMGRDHYLKETRGKRLG
jgi:predicted amidohydrolase